MEEILLRIILWIIAISLIATGCEHEWRSENGINQVFAAVQYCTGFLLLGIGILISVTKPAHIPTRIMNNFAEIITDVASEVGKAGKAFLAWIVHLFMKAGRSFVAWIVRHTKRER